MPIQSTNFDAATLSSLRFAKGAQRKTAHAQTQMKTGRRITSVKVDASGSAIAATLKARNVGANEGVRNLQEASAALGIAESTLDIVADKLNNLKALGVRAATALKVTANRALIQKEITEINKSITAAVAAAEYNGKKLLTGGINRAIVRYGIGELAITLLTSTLSALGLPGGAGHFRNISSGANADPNQQILSYITWVGVAIEKLSKIRGNLGAMQVLVDSAIESVQSNIDRTEEARSTIEDIDALESQANATTAQSQQNLSLQAFLLSLQNNFKNSSTGMQTMQMLMQS